MLTFCNPFARSLEQSGVRPDRTRVLPNSIAPSPHATPDEVLELSKRLGIHSQDRVVLAVGRFSSERGHADLLQATAKVIHELPGLPIRLVLLGDGVERDRMEQLASSLRIRERVIFAGHHADTRPFFARANVFVLPSLSEGSPNVLLEAMEAGLPVVSTAVGGVPETVVDEESTLLVQPRDPQVLGTALRRILSDGPLAVRLAKAAYAKVQEHFRPDHYRKALLDMYSDLYAGVTAEKGA